MICSSEGNQSIDDEYVVRPPSSASVANTRQATNEITDTSNEKEAQNGIDRDDLPNRQWSICFSKRSLVVFPSVKR